MSATDYKIRGIDLVENSPEEICDAAIEMLERLNGSWRTSAFDNVLQQQFWKIYTTHVMNSHLKKPLHGKIRARFGTSFLLNNQEWLQ